MSDNACLYVLDKTHPKYPSLMIDLEDWTLSDEYKEVIVASLTTMRGQAATMYLEDRFLTKYRDDAVGEWSTVVEQLLSDVECFLKGTYPSDMTEESWTVRPQFYHGSSSPYNRRNSENELELVKDLMDFVRAVSDSSKESKDLYVVRSYW